jgi:DnaJ-class molecular chaperone
MPVRGDFGKYGNLIVTININFPKQYSQKQLEQISKIFGDQAAPQEDEL